MNQVRLELYSYLNRTAARRGLALLGIGCAADSEVETISTSRRIWQRPAGPRPWRVLKPLAGNL